MVAGLFNLSFTGTTIKITVQDAETQAPIQGAEVTITGIDWQDTGIHIEIRTQLEPTDNTGKTGTSISTWGTIYLSISAEGYQTQTRSIATSSTETVSKTINLSPIQNTNEPSPNVSDETPTWNNQTNTTNETTSETKLNIDNKVSQTLKTYSIITANLGAGIYLLGTTWKKQQ